MNPKVKEAIDGINKLHNIGNTHEEIKELITQYGKAMHEFIEHDPLVKTGELKGLQITQAEYDRAANPNPVPNKDDGEMTKLLKSGKEITFGGTVDAATLDTIRAASEGEAAADLNAAKSAPAKKKKGDDIGSEYFVDAAVAFFKAALCVYCGNDLANAKLPSAGGPAGFAVFNASWKYASLLSQAANALLQAAKDEDGTDYAEIIAENIVANILYKEASAVFDKLAAELSKGTLTINPQKPFDDEKGAASQGVKDSDVKQKGWVK